MPLDPPDDSERFTGPAAQAEGEVRLHVERLRWSGRGRGRVEGRPVDVRGADVDEVVDVRLDGGRGRLLRVVEPSRHRVDPRCAQIAECPGCPLRPLSPARRQALADALHRDALARHLPDGVPWRRLPGASDDGGRSRAVARALRGADGRLVLGMVEAGGRPIELGRCPVQSPRSRALVAALERDLRRAGVAPFDPERRVGTLRHAIVQAVGDAARVILAVDGEGPPVPVDALLADAPEVPILIDALPRRGAGLVRRPQAARGEPWLWIELDGDRLRAGPRAWIPQAPETVPALRRAVLDALQLAPGDRVVEIGCGIGVLSLPIARRAAGLVGVDIERDAVLDAEVNAAAHGLAGARFRTGEATHALRRLLAAGHACEAVVLHAMRRPFGAEAMAAVAALGPSRVVYLAPSARALARDLDALRGFRVVDVAVCDQTPGSVPDLVIATARPTAP